MAHKQEIECSSCNTIYTIVWDKDEQELPPINCPFCGYEVEVEEDDAEFEQDDIWD